jgi:cellulose biosynthesis protein BcsQ
MIIAFQGAEHKVGTTMIAQSFAEVLAKEETGERILLLLFSTNRGRNYIKDDLGMEYLSKHIPLLIENKFDNEDIYNGCWNEGNLFIFGGIDRRYKLHDFYPDMAQKIIDAAKDQFKHIIIDAGATLDFGLSMPAILNITDSYYYILDQSESSINEMIDIKSYFKKYLLNPKGYIINRYDEEDIYTLKYIANRLNVEQDQLLKLPEIPKSRKMEVDRTTFVKGKDKVFTKAMTTMVNDITQR